MADGRSQINVPYVENQGIKVKFEETLLLMIDEPYSTNRTTQSIAEGVVSQQVGEIWI